MLVVHVSSMCIKSSHRRHKLGHFFLRKVLDRYADSDIYLHVLNTTLNNRREGAFTDLNSETLDQESARYFSLLRFYTNLGFQVESIDFDQRKTLLKRRKGLSQTDNQGWYTLLNNIRPDIEEKVVTKLKEYKQYSPEVQKWIMQLMQKKMYRFVVTGDLNDNIADFVFQDIPPYIRQMHVQNVQS